MRWRFRSRLKSSQVLRLRELNTRAAAFWDHLGRGLPANYRHSQADEYAGICGCSPSVSCLM